MKPLSIYMLACVPFFDGRKFAYGRAFHAKNIAEYLRMCYFCITHTHTHTHTEASRVKITNFIQPATTPQRLLRRGVRRRVPLRQGYALYLYYNAKPNMRL